MRTKISVVVLMLTAWWPFTMATTPAKLGAYWYENRSEGAEGIYARAEPINRAIACYEQAFGESPSQEITIALLKCYYFKGSFVRMSKDERRSVFERGRDIGEVMVKSFPDSAPIKYWLAALLGKWAKNSNSIQAAYQGVADRIRELAEDVIRLDPEYNEAGGFEILGLLHLYAPRIPFFLTWPSNALAFENLQKAARMAPSIANTLCLAQALHKEGKIEMAIQLLEKTLKMKPVEDKLIEGRNGLKQTMDLLQSLKEKKS